MKEKKEVNILMVDDHKITTEGYELILENTENENFSFACDSAQSCDSAWEKILARRYDLILLDLGFPINPKSKFPSGEELGQKIKEEYPETKIIIITDTNDSFRLSNILSKINPEGFLLKGETNSREIARCVETVLDDNTYYSPKVSKLVRSHFTNTHNLDEYDRKILHLLSLGTKTKDLPKYVPLSLRAIELKKRNLKDIFDAEDNEDLLRNAREAGYL